MPKNRRFGKCN